MQYFNICARLAVMRYVEGGVIRYEGCDMRACYIFQPRAEQQGGCLGGRSAFGIGGGRGGHNAQRAGEACARPDGARMHARARSDVSNGLRVDLLHRYTVSVYCKAGYG